MRKTPADILSKVQSYSLEHILYTAFLEKCPVALWKLPNQATYHLIVAQETKKILQADLEQIGSGFLMAPFEASDDNPLVFVSADLHFTLQVSEETTPHAFTPQVTWAADTSFQEHFLQKLARQTDLASRGHFFARQNLSKEGEATEQHYIQMVEKAVSAMQAGAFQKVVLSRYRKQPIRPNFNVAKSFLRIARQYPSAFVSLTSSPETGTWLGASPEILVEIDKQQYFRTIALAGTQPKTAFPSLKEVTWKQKEIEEQAMVSRYIINCFKKIRLREFEEIGPRTVAAASLVHLRTDFLVDLNATHFPELGSVMLQLLHPTSAVCGMPKQEALNFLLEEERYNRAYYSGYLGPVRMANSTHLFVNLRCVQLTQSEAVFYAGAGITADSVAAKEWEETALKMQTIASLL